MQGSGSLFNTNILLPDKDIQKYLKDKTQPPKPIPKARSPRVFPTHLYPVPPKKQMPPKNKH